MKTIGDVDRNGMPMDGFGPAPCKALAAAVVGGMASCQRSRAEHAGHNRECLCPSC